MLASRKILLKHFNARAGEYHAEISNGNEVNSEASLDQAGEPVCYFAFSTIWSI
jgi:hypothetical protein